MNGVSGRITPERQDGQVVPRNGAPQEAGMILADRGQQLNRVASGRPSRRELQALDPVFLAIGIERLGQAVAVEKQRVPRLEAQGRPAKY